MKIIFYCHRGALGDFALAMYSLRLLRVKFPYAQFVGLGRPDYLQLAKQFSLCDTILDCEAAIFADFFSGERIPDKIVKADSSILWLHEGEKIASLLSKADKKVLLIEPFFGKEHTGKRYFSAVSKFFLGVEENISDYFIIRSKREAAKIAIIHPGSGSAKKNLNPSFYLNLAEKIKNRGFDYRFVFGAVEIENALHREFPSEISIFPENCISLWNCINGAALYVGNDSGPTHLAAFCGIPTFAIFAESDSSLWHPLGVSAKFANVLKDDDFTEKFDSFLKEASSVL